MSRALRLRSRIAIAGSLLIATTLALGAWSVTAFRRVSRVAGATVTANQHVTDATTRLAGSLEREDDAMLLVLNGGAGAAAELADRRGEVEAAFAQVIDQLGGDAVAAGLRADVDAYQAAIDGLATRAADPSARTAYHEDVNPLLRRAVATTNDIRDQHFRSSQAVARWAGVQSTRSMQIVAAIGIAALVLLGLIVVHLARVVALPIGELTRAVDALRAGDFQPRVAIRRDDELGRLAAGFNRMADELDRFRRTNIGEVLHAKGTLEATLAALPDAVVVIDNDRQVAAANPRARDLHVAALAGALDDLPVPAATRELVERVLDTGVAPPAAVDLSRAIDLPAARGRRLLPRVVPIADRRGAVLVLSDVTELARLDEMRLELVAVASHELRTPLTTMRMTLSMLDERAAAHDGRDRELVATAMVGVEQLSLLVDEFLDLTRIEAGELRLQWARVSLRELVDRTVSAIAPTAEQAGLTVAVEHGEVPPSIAADPARLAMALANLLANAVKYTPAAGRVAVRTSATSATATIEVTDSGPGVPAEYRERVFERFFRVEQAAAGARGPAGAGIGLYIARQVIEAHGGTIRCGAAAPAGASFVMTIPTEPPAA